MAVMLVPGWENVKEAFENYLSITTKHMQAEYERGQDFCSI